MLGHTQPRLPTHVIFSCSSHRFRAAYDVLRHELKVFGHIVFHDENDEAFREVCAGVVSEIQSWKLLFLVDDDIFIAPVDLGAFALDCSTDTIGSLRLGSNLNWCYPRNSEQQLPRFIDLDCDPTEERHVQYISWYWEEGILDWGYPLSLDGHVFNTTDIQIILKHAIFHSPNTLEAHIQPVKQLLHGYKGLAFRTSRLVNTPLNRVQNDFDNRFGAVHQDVLLRHWEDGFQLNLKKLRGMIVCSAHQEIQPELEKREAKAPESRVAGMHDHVR